MGRKSKSSNNELINKRKAASARTADIDRKRQDRSTLIARSIIAIDRNNLEPAKELLNDLMRNTHLIHDPDLKFVKSFLLHFDCRDLPPAETYYPSSSQEYDNYENSDGEWDEVECEEDDFLEDRIDDKLQAPETTPPPPCGASPAILPTDESDIERATQLKQDAMQAINDGDLHTATDCLSSALLLVPSALLYAKRAEVLLLSQRPTAALVDCNRALEINPDSAKALKMRGHVQRAFGDWEPASIDLKRGLDIDHDDAAEQALKECQEALERVAQRRQARLQRERTRMYKRYTLKTKDEVIGPRTMTPDAMADIMNDPDMVLAMTNPKVLEAMKDVMANPEAVVNYMHDPEISMVITKLMVKINSPMCPEHQSDSTNNVADMDASTSSGSRF